MKNNLDQPPTTEAKWAKIPAPMLIPSDCILRIDIDPDSPGGEIRAAYIETSDKRFIIPPGQEVGKTVDWLLEKLGVKVISGTGFSLADIELPKRPPKTRGPKQKQSTKERIELLERFPVSVVADILTDREYIQSLAMHLSAGQSQEHAEYMAKADAKVFRQDEMNRIRATKSDYDFTVRPVKRRQKRTKSSAKKIGN